MQFVGGAPELALEEFSQRLDAEDAIGVDNESVNRCRPTIGGKLLDNEITVRIDLLEVVGVIEALGNRLEPEARAWKDADIAPDAKQEPLDRVGGGLVVEQ